MKKIDDSAQLLLIAGFAVGVGIVIITVMLNNVIYASNIASESSIDTSRYDMTNAIQMTTEACEDAYKYARINGSANVDNDTFQQYMENYIEKASENYGITGLTFSCQTGNIAEAYFTHNGLADGEDDWTLIQNINTTESFALSIPYVSKLGNEANKVTIEATNVSSGAMLWSMELYNSSGKINVTVMNSSSIIDYYESGLGSGEINITGDKIDTSDTPFYFSEQTTGHQYSISIINGSQAVGTYTISGNLSTGQSFTQIRYRVVNPIITMSSREMTINRTVPISLPGGSL